MSIWCSIVLRAFLINTLGQLCRYRKLGCMHSVARQEESGWDPKPVCFVLTPLMILLLLLEQHANKGFSQPNICRYLHRGVYGNEISEA